jgi:hypothetical protein
MCEMPLFAVWGETTKVDLTDLDALQKRCETDANWAAAPERGRIQERPKDGQVSRAGLRA